MQSLIPTVFGLGLAVAVCSPVSVVTVIVLLTMPSGRRRGVAFVLGWLLAVVVGAFMLTYSLTIAAAAEILKANVSTGDDVLAFVVFAVASIVSIVAPIVVALIAPDRADQRLAAWRQWLLGNSRVIGRVALAVIGVALIIRGAHDLIA